VGLCHGISGNGYALLALARATGQAHYRRAARAFALYAAQHWQELYEGPDRPASLYEVRRLLCVWRVILRTFVYVCFEHSSHMCVDTGGVLTREVQPGDAKGSAARSMSCV
jgi:hypothetical protein